MSLKYRYIVGIDPGTKTGFAVWDTEKKDFLQIITMPIHEAIFALVALHVNFSESSLEILVKCENPFTWKPFKQQRKDSSSRLQGAGSIKRDFSIWRDLCKDMHIPFQGVDLQKSLKKLPTNKFKQITGYKKQTTNHSRDAAMLVFQHNGN